MGGGTSGGREEAIGSADPVEAEASVTTTSSSISAADKVLSQAQRSFQQPEQQELDKQLQPPLLPPALLRRAAAAADASEVLDLLTEELLAPGSGAATTQWPQLTEEACRDMLTACLQRGNAALALSIFRAMAAAGRGGSPGSSSGLLGSLDEMAAGSGTKAALRWPSADVATTVGLVVGLCEAGATREALACVADLRGVVLPSASEDVGFGFVVACPPPRAAPPQRVEAAAAQWQAAALLGPDAVLSPAADALRPLAVVQPQEGVRVVADAYSRYEYELYSGAVASASSGMLQAPHWRLLVPYQRVSNKFRLHGRCFHRPPNFLHRTAESLASEQNPLAAVARRIGLLRRPPTGAVHTLVVQTPTGQQRSFRFATSTADVPAKLGDRVTMVCCPQQPQLSARRLLAATPPGAKPGEVLSLSNHTSSSHVALLRPPAPGSGGVPSWVLPAAVLLAGSDAASALIDPALPLLLAGATVGTAAVGLATNGLLLPRLRQLPERSVTVQAQRQRLLAQHVALEARVAELATSAADDVRALARLAALAAKMGGLGGAARYDARLGRVADARAGVAGRLAKTVELVDAYARVLSMIEIEVEMESGEGFWERWDGGRRH